MRQTWTGTHRYNVPVQEIRRAMTNRDLKQELIDLIIEHGIEEAERKFLAGLPALDPAVVQLRRSLFVQLVEGDDGEWYFDER